MYKRKKYKTISIRIDRDTNDSLSIISQGRSISYTVRELIDNAIKDEFISVYPLQSSDN